MRNAIMVLVVLSLSLVLPSCVTTEIWESDPSYYYFERYIVPQKGRSGKVHAGLINIVLQGDVISESHPRFKELSKEYGEKGTSPVPSECCRSIPSRCKPCDVIALGVFRVGENETVDVSDQFQILYGSYENFIRSGYRSSYPPSFFWKKMKDLTPHDLKWLEDDFDLACDPSLDLKDLFFIITTKDGVKTQIKLGY